MPMPLWFGHVNKRIFNPRELKRGERPVLTHVGRSSGTTYRTPLDAHRVDGGFVFICVYGRRSDWVQNVLAAGSASLTIDGATVRLVTPRFISVDDARRRLPERTKPPPGWLNITDYLRMDVELAA